MNTKQLILLLYFILLNSAVNLPAQNITGKIVCESSSEPLSFANVVLINASDSMYISGTVSDNDGIFALNIPYTPNKYLIRTSFLGYNSLIAKVESDNVGSIYLSPDNTKLNEVIVTTARKTFRMEGGGITADIQNSRLKDMGSLSEVLGQLPFVIKNQDTYTVLGKGSPVFYINNRIVRNDFELQQINSKEIKKITVITNPGAEYDASVNAVIKIETIRPMGEGLSGDVFTYNRRNTKWWTYNNVSLNYRQSKFDIFSSFSLGDMNFPKNRLRSNSLETKDHYTEIITNAKENDKLKLLSPRLGMNYIINNNHSLGGQYQYNNIYANEGKYNQNIEVIQDMVLENKLHSDKNYYGAQRNHYTNVYYAGTLSKWFNLKFDFDYLKSNNKTGNNTKNTLENNIIENIITYNTAESDLYAAKLVLNTPLWKGNLAYGIELSHTRNQQDSYVTENDGAPGIVPSTNRVRQNLAAGFISFRRNFGNFSANAGFRFENISSEYFQNNQLVKEQSKDYQNLFPNFQVLYNNKKVQMELAYKNSVQRPNYADLRSGIFYLAPYSYFSGDPLLQAAYTKSLTYMFMWRKITFMTIYNSYKDRFIEMMPQLYLENSILSKPVNFDKSQQLSVNLSYAPTFGIWKPILEIGMTKDYIKYGNPPIKYNSPLFSSTFRNNIQIKGWQLGMDIYARTKGNRDTEYLEKHSWNTALYLNKFFLKGNLTVNVKMNDIFNTTNDVLSTTTNNIKIYYDNTMFRRRFEFRVNYRFNTTKNRYKGTRASEEADRL